MARQNQERQALLEPKRIKECKEKLESLGFSVSQLGATTLCFTFKEKQIRFYPYSGWASGGSIKDGRGFENLLNQLK